MSKVLGLDLGTGMSCVAVIEAGKPVVVVNEEGTRTTPSVVQITKDEVKIGNAAKRAMVTNPKNTISFVKRLMGADFNDDNVKKVDGPDKLDVEFAPWMISLDIGDTKVIVKFTLTANYFVNKIEVSE